MEREESSGQPTLFWEYQPVRGIYSIMTLVITWFYELQRFRTASRQNIGTSPGVSMAGLPRLLGGARELVDISFIYQLYTSKVCEHGHTCAKVPMFRYSNKQLHRLLTLRAKGQLLASTLTLPPPPSSVQYIESAPRAFHRLQMHVEPFLHAA